MTNITQNDSQPVEAEAANQNAEAAKSESPLEQSAAATTAPGSVSTNQDSESPIATALANNPQMQAHEAHNRFQEILHSCLDKALMELTELGKFSVEELNHIEAIFKKHI